MPIPVKAGFYWPELLIPQQLKEKELCMVPKGRGVDWKSFIALEAQLPFSVVKQDSLYYRQLWGADLSLEWSTFFARFPHESFSGINA